MDSGCLGNLVSLRLVVGLAVTQETESVCLGCLKRAVLHYLSSGESDLNIRKSIKEFISVLVNCGACLNRPHNILAESGAWRWNLLW